MKDFYRVTLAEQTEKINPSALVIEMEGIPTVQLGMASAKNIKVEPMSTDWRWAGSLNSLSVINIIGQRDSISMHRLIGKN